MFTPCEEYSKNVSKGESPLKSKPTGENFHLSARQSAQIPSISPPLSCPYRHQRRCQMLMLASSSPVRCSEASQIRAAQKSRSPFRSFVKSLQTQEVSPEFSEPIFRRFHPSARISQCFAVPAGLSPSNRLRMRLMSQSKQKLSRKGLFATYFSREGRSVRVKPQTTDVADKILSCHVSMLQKIYSALPNARKKKCSARQRSPGPSARESTQKRTPERNICLKKAENEHSGGQVLPPSVPRVSLMPCYCPLPPRVQPHPQIFV